METTVTELPAMAGVDQRWVSVSRRDELHDQRVRLLAHLSIPAKCRVIHAGGDELLIVGRRSDAAKLQRRWDEAQDIMATGRTAAVNKYGPAADSRYLLVREYADGFVDGVAAHVGADGRSLERLTVIALGGWPREHPNTSKRSAVYRAGRRDSDAVADLAQ